MQKIYPFKFLNSYQRDDKDFFFGRNEEIDSLYKMIFQTKILVVFGTSGTGKTSLIQCGLANKFQDYDWLALYIRRGNNLLSSLDKALCDETDGIFTYDNQKKTVIKDLPAKIRAVYKTSFKPLYLFFDQFEELYLLGTKNEQINFIEAIKEILAIEQPVKIILSIREEYLGYLYEFEKEVPQLLRKKLRVEPMTLDKVNDVLKGVNDFKFSLVRIKTEEVNAITEEIFERLKGKEKTLTIQLPYLQVFLDKLYINQTNDESHQTEALISLEDLKKIGNIDDVLKDFLEEQVRIISQELSSKKGIISAETIWKILSNFCTLEGTKEPISKKKLADQLKSEIDKNIINNSVDEFEKKRILNKSVTEDLYELAHDSLALKIAEKRSEDDISKLEVKRIIKSKAVLEEYFTEKQLNFIDPYLNKLSADLTDDEMKLIEDSKTAIINQRKEREKAEQKKRVRRRKWFVSIVGFIIIGLLISGYFGNKRIIKYELLSDVEKINVKIASVNSNIVRVGDIGDKNPTLALQIDKEALIIIDSVVNKLIDTLENKKYRYNSPLQVNKVSELKLKIKSTQDQIKTQAKNILEKDNALYKIVKPKNLRDTIFDIRFINGIFPDIEKDTIFKLWYAEKHVIDSIKSHGILAQVVFPKDSNEAMVLYKNETARYWGNNKHYRKLLMEPDDRITSIAAIHYDVIGYKMLSAMNKKRIVEWNLNGKKRVSGNWTVIYEKEDIQVGDSIVSITISPNRAKIFTASVKGMGIIWSADTINVELDTVKMVFALNQDTIICSSFSNNGLMIVTGSIDNSVKIWSSENGDLIKALNGHTGPVTSVAFSANDTIIYTGSLDRTFRQWHLPALDSITKLPLKPWNKPISFDSLFIMNIIDHYPSKNTNLIEI